MDILQKKEEITRALQRAVPDTIHGHYDEREIIAKSQAKHIFNWGEDCCEHDNGTNIKRWACPICRLEFKEIVGER